MNAYEKALQKIKQSEMCKSNLYCCSIIGPTGPTGPAGAVTGPTDISGIFFIETTSINSVLTVRNLTGNASALTITPLAGGTNPVSAHLVIIQIQ